MLWAVFRSSLFLFISFVEGGFCPSHMQPNTTVCADEQARCTFVSFGRPSQTSCNVLCGSISSTCATSYSISNNAGSFFDVPSSSLCDVNSGGMDYVSCATEGDNMRCECVETVEFVAKHPGQSTACRAYQGQNASDSGCGTSDGCYYNLTEGVYNTTDACKLACAGDAACLGVEWGDWGETSRFRCEIWKFSQPLQRIPFWVPSKGFSCWDKIPGKICYGPPNVSSAFVYDPVDCPFPLSNNRSCVLQCAPNTYPSEDLSMVCVQGNLTFPNTSLCQPKKPNEVLDLVRVTFALAFDINATCDGMMTMASATDVRTIALAFADNVKTLLNMTAPPSYISAVATPDGMNATLLFQTAPAGKPTALDYVQQFLTQKEKDDRLTTFNISSINGICTLETNTLRLYISFTSLFAYLKGLADWMLYTVFGILILFIIIFLVINRKSDHPFAMLGAVLSIINLGARIVFIKFLWDVKTMLTAQGIDAYFFLWCFNAAVLVAGVTLVFNLVATLVLLRYHAAKNIDSFRIWWTKHCFGITLGMSLCALNPANFMVFCSSTFNLDLFKGPISHSAQKHFQLAGIVSVLLGDVTPIVLNILTLFEVDENSQLAWDGGTNSIMLPLIISVASIFVGVIRRVCFICVKPQELKKLEECELVYEPEPELVQAVETPTPTPKVVPFLAPMKQMEEGWAGVSLNQHLISPSSYSPPSPISPPSPASSSSVQTDTTGPTTNNNYLSLSPPLSPPSPKVLNDHKYINNTNNRFDDESPHFYPSLTQQNSQHQLLESQDSSQNLHG